MPSGQANINIPTSGEALNSSLAMLLLKGFALVAVVAAAALGYAIKEAGGPDEAFYQLLPHIPAEHFANLASWGVRLSTCELRPVLDLARSAGLLQPKLDCGIAGLPVAVSTVKGGSILTARVFIDTAFHCGLCVGYGMRESGSWPPPAETVPSYASDAVLAIALVKGWPAYARAQLANADAEVGATPTGIGCSVTVREPLSRLVSMFLYFEAAGEYALRNVSAHMKSLPSVEERALWMFEHIGEDTMLDSHQYLADSLQQGCVMVHFEAFASDFEAASRLVLGAWGVDAKVHDELIGLFAPKLDMSMRSPEQLARDHHHSASKFPAQYKGQVKAAFEEIPQVMALVQAQRKDLGY